MTDDKRILELLNIRDEAGLKALSDKYTPYLMKIASNFLSDRNDCEECLNDVFMRVWQEKLSVKPELLSVHLASLVREICIDYYRKNHRKKRIASEYTVSLSEIGDLASDGKASDPEESIDRMWLSGLLNAYFRTRPKEVRNIFIMRYYYFDSVSEIAKRTGSTVMRINTLLSRERKRLRKYLEQEGYEC